MEERSDDIRLADENVDRLVREHLDRVAAVTDASALVERVRASNPGRADAAATHEDPTSLVATSRREFRAGGERGPRSSRLAWIVPALATVAAAFLLGRWFAPSKADAATVLTAVLAVQNRGDDRQYRATFHPDPAYWDGKNVLRGPSETILWTRGDRFWADTRWGDLRIVYGQDETGSVWLSPSRDSGIRLVSGDAPDEIDLYCAINSMTASRLIDDVLQDFDLQITQISESASPTPASDRQSVGRTAILATLKPDREHPFLSSALLEIDEHDVLVRLILWTLHDGQPRGTVTYTLTETARLDDATYRLPYHVDADAEIKEQAFEPARDPEQAQPANDD